MIVHDLLVVEEPLINEVAGPDHIDPGRPQETDDSITPIGPEVHRVERDPLVSELVARLHQRETRHVERCLVLLRHLGGETHDVVMVGAVGVHPVRADLTDDISTRLRHRVHIVLEQVKVVRSLFERVGVLRRMEQATVDADRVGRYSKEIRRRGIPVLRRAGETDLIRKKLVIGIRPFGGLAHRAAPIVQEKRCRPGPTTKRSRTSGPHAAVPSPRTAEST